MRGEPAGANDGCHTGVESGDGSEKPGIESSFRRKSKGSNENWASASSGPRRLVGTAALASDSSRFDHVDILVTHSLTPA